MPNDHIGRRKRAVAVLTSCALIAVLLPAPVANAAGRKRAAAGKERAAAAQAGSHRMTRAARMRHRFAEWSLRANGIAWRSSGRCSDRRKSTCTSFDGIRWGTVDGLIDFREDSGCRLMVSGGTERGHARGRYSHGNGYKLDIMPGRCADRYIARHYPRAGTRRGDRAALHRSPTGAVFAREASHWDIMIP